MSSRIRRGRFATSTRTRFTRFSMARCGCCKVRPELRYDKVQRRAKSHSCLSSVPYQAELVFGVLKSSTGKYQIQYAAIRIVHRKWLMQALSVNAGYGLARGGNAGFKGPKGGASQIGRRSLKNTKLWHLFSGQISTVYLHFIDNFRLVPEFNLHLQLRCTLVVSSWERLRSTSVLGSDVRTPTSGLLAGRI
jgi:hypothetical protein